MKTVLLPIGATGGNQPLVQPPSMVARQERVIQPREGFQQELQAQQQLVQPTMGAPLTPTPQLQPSSSPPSVSTETSTSDTVSADLIARVERVRTAGRRQTVGRSIKQAVILLVILAAAVVGGYVFVHDAVTGMTTRTLSNGGYTYSFTFNKAASLIQSPTGAEGYRSITGVIASVQPINANVPEHCSEIGSRWQEAFTVQVYGSTHPVCTPGNNRSYALLFTALGHNHLFSVTYSSVQPPAIYPQLRIIMGSVQVSQ